MLKYKIMNQKDISVFHLDNYIREQHTKNMKYVEYNQDGTLKSYDLYETSVDFKDEWDRSRKREICKYLMKVKGTVIFVFDKEEVIGFCNIDHHLYEGYMVMPYIHVSKPYRHMGIAKKLFKMICEEAKRHGAEKLYISAHPAVETYRFYESVGCVLTQNILKIMFEKEPADLQLEKDLYDFNIGETIEN